MFLGNDRFACIDRGRNVRWRCVQTCADNWMQLIYSVVWLPAGSESWIASDPIHTAPHSGRGWVCQYVFIWPGAALATHPPIHHWRFSRCRERLKAVRPAAVAYHLVRELNYDAPRAIKRTAPARQAVPSTELVWWMRVMCHSVPIKPAITSLIMPYVRRDGLRAQWSVCWDILASLYRSDDSIYRFNKCFF